MKIHIAHSPDSDDAFMFYGLASGKVPIDGIRARACAADIETLNRAAFEGRYEITAVSFHAYAHLTDKYMLLPHGASMGDRYGPVVVAQKRRPASLDGRHASRFPGELTTAFLALRLYDPAVEYVVMPFDEIQEAVHAGEVEAGLLIHEGQLTYEDEGLRKIVDLGEWWAERTGGLPLPLGGNVIRRELGPATMRTLSRMLHDSIAYRSRAPRRSARLRDAVRPRPRPARSRSIRRDVRERADARLRRARPRGGAAVCSTTRRRPACCRSRSRSSSRRKFGLRAARPTAGRLTASRR